MSNNKSHLWQKGQSGNPGGIPRRKQEPFLGMMPSEWMQKSLGPMAIQVLNNLLHNAVNKNPNDLTKMELDAAKFIHDKAYGKAADRVEMLPPQDQEQYSVEHLDPVLIEQLANLQPQIVEAEVVEKDKE